MLFNFQELTADVPMPQLQTNRDLYLAVGELCRLNQATDRSLEQYLAALLRLVGHLGHRDTISLDVFHSLLADAFTAESSMFDQKWRETYVDFNTTASGFQGVVATLVRQIVDLREMEETGSLADEFRFFGINAPRGSRWYNFSPASYLECGMAGSLGGWEPGDDTGREYVPGKVAVLNEDGTIQSVNPEDLDRPVYETGELSWDDIQEFLLCGQIYE